ncbi:Lar family restriction alleviation protein [Enterococcus sp. AZ107]|uniref:Lar family restriction alleviation protein n=1 Tax=unclassified Enterococcus TaxID=2608891 RepID=UPI003ED59424
MSKIHIKPCPFCGSENISFNSFSISSDAYVLCEQCNASIEISVPWDGMDEKEHDKVCFEKLSALWNNRVSERNQTELNEKQEYLLRGLVCKFDTLGLPPTPFQAVYWLMHNGDWNGSSDLHKAITSLDNKQQAQVLRAFADWIEQEEEK